MFSICIPIYTTSLCILHEKDMFNNKHQNYSLLSYSAGCCASVYFQMLHNTCSMNIFLGKFWDLQLGLLLPWLYFVFQNITATNYLQVTQLLMTSELEDAIITTSYVFFHHQPSIASWRNVKTQQNITERNYYYYYYYYKQTWLKYHKIQGTARTLYNAQDVFGAKHHVFCKQKGQQVKCMSHALAGTLVCEKHPQTIQFYFFSVAYRYWFSTSTVSA